MSGLKCSAPGKMFLGGEYAVLDGAEAVVTAVGRRVVVERAAQESGSTSPVIEAVVRQLSVFFQEQREELAGLSPVEVNSAGFQIGRSKIGLGSSAAVAAAVCGAYFEMEGRAIDDHRTTILRLASAAHRRAQKGKGSGADVAASVLGGTLIFTTEGKIELIDTASVEIVPVWSGRAISTSELLGKIEAFKKRAPLEYGSCFKALGDSAAELAQSYRSRDPRQIIESTIRYGKGLAELGQASGASILTRELKLVATLAQDLGGGAKPSGAGGGDVAIAVFDNAEVAKLFRTLCIRYELVPLDLSLDAPGLRRDETD